MAVGVKARAELPVERLTVSAFEIPTDGPESDGTLEWDSTTLVVVEAEGAGTRGLGYTYAPAASGRLVEEKLVDIVSGRDALDVRAIWSAMNVALRNAGRRGVGSTAMAAVDMALWDLMARALDLPLFRLLGAAHDEVPIYGSGGFTSYSLERLREQLGGWVADGIPRVKM